MQPKICSVWILAALTMSLGCSTDPKEKISSIYSLKADPTERNVAKIRAGLTDPDRDVRATALNALVGLRVDDARALALAGLDDPDGFVRATACKLIGDLGDGRDVAALAARLRADADPIVRRRAAEALTVLGGPEATAALAEALADPMEDVRLAAVRGLRELDPSGAKPTLARLVLEDPMFEIRVQAARALGETGDAEMRPVLEAALSDPNEFVRAAAANALRVLAKGGRPGKAMPPRPVPPADEAAPDAEPKPEPSGT